MTLDNDRFTFVNKIDKQSQESLYAPEHTSHYSLDFARFDFHFSRKLNTIVKKIFYVRSRDGKQDIKLVQQHKFLCKKY